MHLLLVLVLVLVGLLARPARSQEEEEEEPESTLVLTGTKEISLEDDPAPTDPSLFTSLSSTIIVTDNSSATLTTDDGDGDGLLTATTNSNGSAITSATETLISGDVTPTTTEDGPLPSNTRPCNGHPSFCERSYGNLTQVAAHNSPFVRPGNLASNQHFDVTAQLNDGIRMLQFQTHDLDGTVHLCHSSCDLLDAGPLQDYLATVAGWLKAHPYDVVSLLIGNADFLPPTTFASSIEDSGLRDYSYEPPKIPMARDDWPTLTSLILSNRRAIIFMDYQADQSEVPYVLDEFSQMWETPFSPTDRDFPCTVERPPGLSPEDARDRLYMANHNLNTEVSLLGSSLLVPNTVLLNETNAVSGYGSLGAMASNCAEDWGKPPNFLLVDYYNIGSYNGSVFEVVANMNNVTYKNDTCCGGDKSAAALAASSSQAYLALVTTLLLLLIVL